MRKFLTVALTFGLFFGTLSVATTASAYENDYSKWAKTECRMARNGDWNNSEVRDGIRCVVIRLGASDRVRYAAMHIASRESGYNERARNPYSTAGGLFQWLASSWPGHSYPALNRKYDLSTNKPETDGGGDRFQARTAIFVSVKRMLKDCQPWIYQGQVLC